MTKFVTGYRSPVFKDGTFFVLRQLPTGDYERFTVRKERKANLVLGAQIVYWVPPRKAKAETVPCEFGSTTA
jgi:hypothetical protein